jgi:hypothetical protein
MTQRSLELPASISKLACNINESRIHTVSKQRRKGPIFRTAAMVLGVILLILAPIVGAIPGPGGLVLVAAGLTLVLRYSGWAKRLYIRSRRRWPNHVKWLDKALRRKNRLTKQ